MPMIGNAPLGEDGEGVAGESVAGSGCRLPVWGALVMGGFLVRPRVKLIQLNDFSIRPI